MQRSATRSIIEDFIACDEDQFAQAGYGFELDGEEQRRRFVIQSLLTDPGLSHAAYEQRFGAPVRQDLPQLQELMALELATDEAGLFRLSARGVAYSDTIGPWLASAAVRGLMPDAPC
ncbi:coproporphyrinogen III oxidase [compost metagenome]